jgi:hypothetical protein
MNNFSKSYLKPWGIELVKKYPLIFLEPDMYNVSYAKQGGVSEADYVNLRYGFECHEGWTKIIEEISKTGTELVTYLREHGYPDAYIHSCIVKEKFATLAWQEGSSGLPSPFNALWRAFVIHQEYQTGHICEETGKIGSIRIKRKDGTTGWQRTLCVEKAIEFGYELEDWENKKYEKQIISDEDKKVLCEATSEVIAEIETHTGC